MDGELPQFFKFGPFRLELDARRLLREGEPIPLTPKAFDTLVALVRRNGHVVKKEELLNEVWPDTFVEEATLAQNIFTLRKALGQDENGSQYIETVPKQGYRFAAGVERVNSDPLEIVLATRTRTHIVSEEIERSYPPGNDSVEVSAEASHEVVRQGSDRLAKANGRLTLAGESPSRSAVRRLQPWLAFALIPMLAIGIIGYLRLRRESRPGAVPSFANKRMRFAKLTNNGKVRRAAISPDGKYLAYVQLDGEKQGLWIRQTSSTRSIQVVEPGDMTFQGLTFAPDSNSIYYDVYEGENKNAILYQIPVLGGASRKTLEDVDSSIAFAPDGKHFAFVRNEANRKESSILIADAEGGNERRLTSRPGFPAFSNEGPTWSPDGKLIVCPTRLTNAGQVKMALIFIDAETGEQRPFNTRQWDAIGQVSWLGDGRGLVLTAWDFSASMFQDQLWEVAYPDGEAHMVTNDLNSYHSVSLTAGAPSLVTIQSDRLANFSIMSKTDLDKPRQITSGSGDKPSEMFGMSWTPDNRIVYGSSASGNVDVWIMNADGTNQKQLTAGPYISFKPSASPDGKTIVYVSRRNDVPHLWKMDYDGKDPVQLTNGSAETLPVISPDGSSIVFVTVKEGVPTLWKMPAQGGNAVQLTTQPTTYPAFSPDGKQIACLFRPEVGAYWQVAIFPSNGGVPLKTFKVPATIYYDAGLRWAPDGQSFSYVDNRSGVSNIWSQPLTGESPKPVTSFNSGQIFRFGWSLDGRLLAVEHGVIINDVVLINLA